MIVSDAHRFVFLHVPKCAGSTVRAALEPYHDHPVRFWGHETVPALGRVDLAHLTLPQLRVAFPEVLERIEAFACFAAVRDPMARFPSSLGERMSHLRQRDLVDADLTELRREANEVIARLQAGDPTTEPAMAFFTRQVDYVELDGRRVVNGVVPVERLDLLEDPLALLLPERPSFAEKRNVRIDPERRSTGPGPADRIAPQLTRTLRRIAPRGLRRRAAAAVFPRGHDAARRLMRDGGIRRFVQSHYAEDFELYAQARAAAAARPPRPNPQEG